jgi:hypothetical protein
MSSSLALGTRNRRMRKGNPLAAFSRIACLIFGHCIVDDFPLQRFTLHQLFSGPTRLRDARDRYLCAAADIIQ